MKKDKEPETITVRGGFGAPLDVEHMDPEALKAAKAEEAAKVEVVPADE